MLIDYTLRPRIPHELLVVIGGCSDGSVSCSLTVTNSVELFDCRANVWLDFKDNDESMLDRLYFISLDKFSPDKFYLFEINLQRIPSSE